MLLFFRSELSSSFTSREAERKRDAAKVRVYSRECGIFHEAAAGCISVVAALTVFISQCHR